MASPPSALIVRAHVNVASFQEAGFVTLCVPPDTAVRVFRELVLRKIEAKLGLDKGHLATGQFEVIGLNGALHEDVPLHTQVAESSVLTLHLVERGAPPRAHVASPSRRGLLTLARIATGSRHLHVATEEWKQRQQLPATSNVVCSTAAELERGGCDAASLTWAVQLSGQAPYVTLRAGVRGAYLNATPDGSLELSSKAGRWSRWEVELVQPRQPDVPMHSNRSDKGTGNRAIEQHIDFEAASGEARESSLVTSTAVHCKLRDCQGRPLGFDKAQGSGGLCSEVKCGANQNIKSKNSGSVFRLELPYVQMAGFLKKKGSGGFKAWQRRFFVLTPTHLGYWRSHPTQQELSARSFSSAIELAACSSRERSSSTAMSDQRGTPDQASTQARGGRQSAGAESEAATVMDFATVPAPLAEAHGLFHRVHMRVLQLADVVSPGATAAAVASSSSSSSSSGVEGQKPQEGVTTATAAITAASSMGLPAEQQVTRFRLNSQGKSMVLQAESSEECKKWLAALRAVSLDKFASKLPSPPSVPRATPVPPSGPRPPNATLGRISSPAASPPTSPPQPTLGDLPTPASPAASFAAAVMRAAAVKANATIQAQQQQQHLPITAARSVETGTHITFSHEGQQQQHKHASSAPLTSLSPPDSPPCVRIHPASSATRRQLSFLKRQKNSKNGDNHSGDDASGSVNETEDSICFENNEETVDPNGVETALQGEEGMQPAPRRSSSNDSPKKNGEGSRLDAAAATPPAAAVATPAAVKQADATLRELDQWLEELEAPLSTPCKRLDLGDATLPPDSSLDNGNRSKTNTPFAATAAMLRSANTAALAFPSLSPEASPSKQQGSQQRQQPQLSEQLQQHRPSVFAPLSPIASPSKTSKSKSNSNSNSNSEAMLPSNTARWIGDSGDAVRSSLEGRGGGQSEHAPERFVARGTIDLRSPDSEEEGWRQDGAETDLDDDKIAVLAEEEEEEEEEKEEGGGGGGGYVGSGVAPSHPAPSHASQEGESSSRSNDGTNDKSRGSRSNRSNRSDKDRDQSGGTNANSRGSGRGSKGKMPTGRKKAGGGSSTPKGSAASASAGFLAPTHNSRQRTGGPVLSSSSSLKPPRGKPKPKPGSRRGAAAGATAARKGGASSSRQKDSKKKRNSKGRGAKDDNKSGNSSNNGNKSAQALAKARVRAQRDEARQREEERQREESRQRKAKLEQRRRHRGKQQVTAATPASAAGQRRRGAAASSNPSSSRRAAKATTPRQQDLAKQPPASKISSVAAKTPVAVAMATTAAEGEAAAAGIDEVRAWTVQDVAAWAKGAGKAAFGLSEGTTRLLKSQEIDGRALLSWSESEMREDGVVRGQAKRLCAAIRSLTLAQPPEALSSSSPSSPLGAARAVVLADGIAEADGHDSAPAAALYSPKSDSTAPVLAGPGSPPSPVPVSASTPAMEALSAAIMPLVVKRERHKAFIVRHRSWSKDPTRFRHAGYGATQSKLDRHASGFESVSTQLRVLIQQWEREAGQPFTYMGEAYLAQITSDELLAARESEQEREKLTKKRADRVEQYHKAQYPALAAAAAKQNKKQKSPAPPQQQPGTAEQSLKAAQLRISELQQSLTMVFGRAITSSWHVLKVAPTARQRFLARHGGEVTQGTLQAFADELRTLRGREEPLEAAAQGNDSVASPDGDTEPSALGPWAEHRAEALELDERIRVLQAELAVERARAKRQREALAESRVPSHAK